ncbi:MAG: glycosyltransferase family 4 protein [Candidatus Gracilibacteria bacterium]|nr:glycosyltransferase family 4 protein [Candidatus Gracilibacteria bacterium]
MNKINIIQFMPYFPPHKGGLETVGEEIGINWQKNNLGFFVNIITSFDQEKEIENNEKIIYKDEVIGYIKNNITHLVIPSFEIINNFPMYKFWDKKTKLIFAHLKENFIEKFDVDSIRVITHTRFFLPSLFGGIFARKHKLKWIHIEHGSDYVKLSSKLKTNLSIIYDKLFGKWIFKKADIVLAISEACKRFINNEFIDRDLEVFYRGIDLGKIDLDKKGDIKFVFIGRLVLLKGVLDLIEVYKELNIKNELIIIGDGDERKNLEKLSFGYNINFLGFKDKEFILDFLGKNNCICINASYMEGLPTSVIESLIMGCPTIASNVGGTSEISDKSDLILFEAGNKDELGKKILQVLENYNDLKGISKNEIEKRFKREESILNLYNFIK